MKYYNRDEAALTAEQAQMERRSSDFGVSVPMLYLYPGTTIVRILPPFSEAGMFFSRVRKHRIARGKSADVFACPQAMSDTFCAICAKAKEFVDSKETAKMDYVRENLRAREYSLYNVVVISGPANGKGEVPAFGTVYVLEAPVSAHRQIISLDQDTATGWADITNPEKGVNLVIKRSGVKFDTKYEVHPHGAGRTNLWTDLTSRGIDPNSLMLHDLNAVYTVPGEDFVNDIASNIPSNIGGPVTQAGPSAWTPPQPSPTTTQQPQQPSPSGPFVSPPPAPATATLTTQQPQPVVQNGPPQPPPSGPFVPPPP